MLCEKCQQNEVSVHLTDIVNNTKREYHLCRDCASSHGVSIKATLENFKNLTIPEFYSPPEDEEQDTPSPKLSRDCPDCGMTYARFRKEGKFGCSRDYDLFSDSLDDLFGNLIALIILTVAAAESSIGLALVVRYYRTKGTISTEFLNLLRG